MEEKKLIRKLSRVGIFGNVLLAAFKLFAGIFGKSGAMVSDAVHSLSDVFATLVAYIGVLLSRQKEDPDEAAADRGGRFDRRQGEDVLVYHVLRQKNGFVRL